MQDPNQKEDLNPITSFFEDFFTIIYTIEMGLKILSMGFLFNKVIAHNKILGFISKRFMECFRFCNSIISLCLNNILKHQF